MTSRVQGASRTFSIIALDPSAGVMGSAVASRYFAVGSVVPHLRQGVGVLNTQHCHDQWLAHMVLELMGEGVRPQDAIDMVLSSDPNAATRQVIAMDVKGRQGLYSGAECTAPFSHQAGENCLAAGNTLASEAVVEAMVASMTGSRGGSLCLRLLDALAAAERAGGDSRGKQSASICLRPMSLDTWEFEYPDLRVDDHAEPLTELRRLYEKRWAGQ